MSLLNQNSPKDIDDAARGEELTKGSSHLIWTSLAAAALVTIAIAVYVIAGQKPPVASGEIITVWAYPHHAESSGFDANGSSMPTESFDQVLVFAQVKLHNQTKEPLFLRNIMTNATLNDGIHSSYAASHIDYDRVFLAYQGIPVPHGKALSLESTIDPGQTLEGAIVSSFTLTKPQWDARKDLNFTFAFKYQPSVVLAPHSAVIEP
jgi:hypothetical protein